MDVFVFQGSPQKMTYFKGPLRKSQWGGGWILNGMARLAPSGT